ncbi:copper-binding protein [Undibacterium sp.]|uniref:copper-binding protein n=1 Tax=Undibacterium sp. TaxID=1914977 RepID=UPI0025D7F95D|nr:copper-binding protein [Undibacterium sp.]
MKNLKSLLLVTLAVGALQTVYAADHPTETKTDPAASIASMDMTEGEVKKIDKSVSKITLKHGDIKNLDMPGMTMVFKVKDPTVLDTLKVGDKVKFRAEKAEGAIFVSSIQIAK